MEAFNVIFLVTIVALLSAAVLLYKCGIVHRDDAAKQKKFERGGEITSGLAAAMGIIYLIIFTCFHGFDMV